MSEPSHGLEPQLVDFRDAATRPALEALGEATWREALDWLYGHALQRPTLAESYPEARRRFYGSAGVPAHPPAGPSPSASVLAEFRQRVAPGTFNSQFPSSFSYFTPAPLPMSIAGETLAQWINQGVDIWHAGPVAAFVEEEVVSWLRELIGFGEGTWGVLTSGGVMANLMALAVARDVHLRRLRELDRAPRGADLEGVRIYASDQAHFSVGRGLDVLGFPSTTLRILPSDERFRLQADVVKDAIAEDVEAGLTPLAIAAVAGSTNTGSVDAIDDLADVSSEAGLWLHVDAAYGGAVRLSPEAAGRVPALERADSVTLDPHKWFFQAYDIGGLLVRHREDLLATFHRAPEYYQSNRPEDEPLDWYGYSVEGTRRFRALKLWMSWKHLGTEGFGRLVDHTLELAEYLAATLRTAPDFEVVPPEPDLGVVCFRHLPTTTMTPDRLDAHQVAVQRALEVGGEAWVSVTTLREHTWLRAGIVNHLSQRADVDRLISALRRSSERVLEELDAG